MMKPAYMITIMVWTNRQQKCPFYTNLMRNSTGRRLRHLSSIKVLINIETLVASLPISCQSFSATKRTVTIVLEHYLACKIIVTCTFKERNAGWIDRRMAQAHQNTKKTKVFCCGLFQKYILLPQELFTSFEKKKGVLNDRFSKCIL